MYPIRLPSPTFSAAIRKSARVESRSPRDARLTQTFRPQGTTQSGASSMARSRCLSATG
jgi:hypothetical protein